ncbi:MAG: hypothetical protein ACPGYK_00100 [Flavobacteriales bacterium]
MDTKVIFRGIAGVLIGIAMGSLSMTAFHSLGMVIWPEEPYPVGASEMELKVWMEGLSLPTKLFASLAHWVGTAAGAAAAVLVSHPKLNPVDGVRMRPMWPAWTLGAWFWIGGMANAWMLGTPLWLTLIDFVGYLPAAWLVGRGLKNWRMRSDHA